MSRRAEARRRGQVSVDEVDLSMLEILREDGRISIAALAEAVGISRANAYARLERLRTEGVIEGFSARINYRKIGLGTSAITFMKVRQPAREALAKHMADLPGVEYAAHVTGEHDVIVLMRAPDVDTMRDDIMAKLYDAPPVKSLHTIFVLDEVVHRSYVLPPKDWR